MVVFVASWVSGGELVASFPESVVDSSVEGSPLESVEPPLVDSFPVAEVSLVAGVSSELVSSGVESYSDSFPVVWLTLSELVVSSVPLSKEVVLLAVVLVASGVGSGSTGAGSGSGSGGTISEYKAVTPIASVLPLFCFARSQNHLGTHL